VKHIFLLLSLSITPIYAGSSVVGLVEDMEAEQTIITHKEEIDNNNIVESFKAQSNKTCDCESATAATMLITMLTFGITGNIYYYFAPLTD
jgi:hypothetical protein